MMMTRRLLLIPLISILALSSTADAASFSIDLGAEFLKMALVKPGVPMETVLNRESQRKTPFALIIRQAERIFGSAAVKKFSATQHAYTYFLDLVGKPFEHPAVADYQQRFPHLQLKKHEQRGTVVFLTDSGELPVESLLAMVLANARAEVEAYAHQPVRDVVIAVPAFFGPAERQAVETAAQIAGLNLLKLLSSGAAAGLNYGVFRYKDITEQPQTIMIYDAGASNVQASVIQFRLDTGEENASNENNEKDKNTNESTDNGVNGDESKEKNATETTTAAPPAAKPKTAAAAKPVPRLEVRGVGFDARLGGHHLTLKVRDHLVEAFRAKHPKLDKDITASPQAMAKLLREADRVKQVLSANQETFAQVESLHQDIDFKHKLTRVQLEQMFAEFEPRYLEPIKAALEMAGTTVEGLDRVLLMGAGTRVPRLQELLTQFFAGKEIGRNLNTDEAIALGAVYQAARESKKFIVKRFDVVDYKPPVPTEEEAAASAAEAAVVKPMEEQEIAQAKTILADFAKREKAKVERDEALNTLESNVYDYSTKLEEGAEEFTRYGTPEELEALAKSVRELKEWLETEVNDETSAEVLKEKRQEMLKPVRKMKRRRRQSEERPEHMDRLAKVLEGAEKQQPLMAMTNTTEVFTQSELDTFALLVTSTRAWFDQAKEEVSKLADNQDASFTVDDLKHKANTLSREVRFMLNQLLAKATPPPPPPMPEEAEGTAANETETVQVTSEEGVGDGRDAAEEGQLQEEEGKKNGTEEAEGKKEELEEDQKKEELEEDQKKEDEETTKVEEEAQTDEKLAEEDEAGKGDEEEADVKKDEKKPADEVKVEEKTQKEEKTKKTAKTAGKEEKKEEL